MHSWRVLLLPFIDEQALYDEYHFDEPWDGPNNQALAPRMPQVYWCPNDARTRPAIGGSPPGRSQPDGERGPHVPALTTRYLAVVGPGTAWPGTEARGFADFSDGLTNTLLLIESHSQPIHWMEPRDLDVDEAIRLLSSPRIHDDTHPREGFFHIYYGGRNVAFADGTVRLLGLLSADRADRMLGIDNGQPFDSDSEELVIPRHLRRPNYGNWVKLAAFLLLGVLFLSLLRSYRGAGFTIFSFRG